ncbi:uncharacterized protein RAG0_15449 [Rhynchosporium agropyri]|uniref:Uncharacterized protein n=1 Tax=Rhynchosporium agropyri TaxID=914238 RepID=A0A1E1LLA4_9HELO|nr:uncharacterized protein RAG0_15449 [Rhynchosporium agropyri]
MSTTNGSNHNGATSGASLSPSSLLTQLSKANLQHVQATQNLQTYLNTPHDYERVKLGLSPTRMKGDGASNENAWDERWKVACGGRGI